MAARGPERRGGALTTARAPRQVAEELLARVRAADDPAPLVAALAPPDLLAALREADDEQRAELLALAAPEQIAGVADLACWREEAFRPAALGELLAPAVAAGGEAAARAWRSLEGELRTLLLKPYVVVHLREDKNEEFPAAAGAELLELPDGLYAVELPDPDAVPEPIRRMLVALLDLPFEECQPELECLRHDLPSELEERALRWRSGRLADQGFAPRADGIAAIAPEDPAVLRRRIAAGERVPRAGGAPLPELFRRCLEGDALLDAALARAAGAEGAGLAARARDLPAERGAMTGLFLSGAGVDLGDLDATARGVRLARDTLALGLAAVTGGDVELAARALLSAPPIAFVRAGMGLLAPLRERARAAGKRLGVAAGRGPLDLLDPPHAAALEALAAEVPRRFPALDAGGAAAADLPLPGDLVGFTDPAQVERAEALLAEVEAIPDLLARLGALGRGAAPPTGATAATALLTALANAAAGRPLAATPLPRQEAEELARRLLAAGADAAIADALAALAGPLGFRADGPALPEDEPEPRRRLALRLLRLGLARIEGAPAAAALIVGAP